MDNLNALTLPTEDIEAVTQQFSLWRSLGKSKGRIPESLWEKVFPLFKYHTTSYIAKSLGISYQQIRSKMTGIQTKTENEDFVSLTMSPITHNKLKSANTHPMQITLKNGVILQCHLSLQDLSLLINEVR